MSPPPETRVPATLRLAAALAWRFLVVVAAVGALVYGLAAIRIVVVPVAIAILLASVLMPLVVRFERSGLPRTLAAAATLLIFLAVIAGVLALAAPAVVDEVDELDVSISGGVSTVTSWLSDGPLGLSERQVASWQAQVTEQLRGESGRLIGGVFGGAYVVVEILAGLALAIVTLFFLLRDGPSIWAWFRRLFPPQARDDVERIGQRAWTTIGGYLRGVSIVAAADAVFIGLALWLLGVPLVLPLALLTFVGGFFPIVGAFAAGFAAAMVALVTNGLTTALLVIAATLVVQQLEGNVLQPLVVGSAVNLHPLAVILAVAAGGIVWGIAGAFLAVPLAAVVNQAATHLANRGAAPVQARGSAP